MAEQEGTFTAFVGTDLVARGSLPEVVGQCKVRLEGGAAGRVVVFDDQSGRVEDVDFSGTSAQVLSRLSDSSAPNVQSDKGVKRGPGRPKLGVVSREVSLLPRHWGWLSEQRGGASGSMRRLVHAAMKDDSHESTSRAAVDAAHRFLWDMAGDLPGFEEATRSLFAMQFDTLEKLTAEWPTGIREQLARYVDRARPDL